jgi:hypothetical protein
VEEEQHFDDALNTVEESIQAAEVGQFVGQDGLGSQGVQVGEEAQGQQDHGTEQPQAQGCDHPG